MGIDTDIDTPVPGSIPPPSHALHVPQDRHRALDSHRLYGETGQDVEDENGSKFQELLLRLSVH